MKTICATSEMTLNSYEMRGDIVTLRLSNAWTRSASQQLHEAELTIPAVTLAGFHPLNKMRVKVTIEQDEPLETGQ